jgi:16S rRNA (guanine527-N7)-methyltransferase
MTEPRFGAGESGPGESSPGPSSFPGRGPRRPIAFPGRSARPAASPAPSPASSSTPATPPAPAASSSADRGVEGVLPSEEFVDVAHRVFGERFELAVEFARLLVTDGVLRGLIGPREAPRIWERHLVNCAVMSDLIPIGASVADVGSGAGLPGIVLAVARPDLSITLVEPLARRTAFLSEAVTSLGLEATVTVVRGRAEDVVDGPPAGADVVTARAVAPLDRLAGWCLPLARTGGRLLALKGSSAAEEVAEHRAVIAELGGAEPVLRLCGVGLIDPPATVVEIVKERDVVRSRPKPSSRAEAPGRGAGGRAGGRGSGRGRTRRG